MGPPGTNPRGVGWGTERDILLSQSTYFLCRVALASLTQASWVSRQSVDRLPLVDWLKLPAYFLGKVSRWLF